MNVCNRIYQKGQWIKIFLIFGATLHVNENFNFKISYFNYIS